MQKTFGRRLFLGIMFAIFVFMIPFSMTINLSERVYGAAVATNPIKVSVVNYAYDPEEEKFFETDVSGSDLSYSPSNPSNIPFAVLDSFNELKDASENTTNHTLTYYNGNGATTSDSFNESSHTYNIIMHEQTESGIHTTNGLAFFYQKEQKWMWSRKTTFTGATTNPLVYHQALKVEFGNKDEPQYQSIRVTIVFHGTDDPSDEGKEIYSSGTEISKIGLTDFQYYTRIINGLNGSVVEDSGLSIDTTGNSFLTREKTNDPSGDVGPIIENVEGLYEITINYSDKKGNPSTANFNFYLVTTNTYANQDDSVAFDYTVKNPVEGSDAETYSYYNYFNHTNIGTTLRDGTTITNDNRPETLIYPTISFNPEKYNVTYSRALYNNKEKGVFDFEVKSTKSMYGTVTRTITGTTSSSTQVDIARKTEELIGAEAVLSNAGKLVSVNYDSSSYEAVLSDNSEYVVEINDVYYYYNTVSKKICAYDTNASFSLEWTFDELGEYEFTKNFKLKIKNKNIIADKDQVQVSDYTFIKSEKLFVNGFKTIYAKNGDSTGNNYLRNESYENDFYYLNGVLSTVTLLKPSSSADVNISNLQSSNTITITPSGTIGGTTEPYDINILNGKIPATNQPPIQFRYFATLNDKPNSSWYAYISSQGIVNVGTFNLATKFTNAGTYFVFISFVDKSTTPTTSFCQQVFAFKITNTPPTVNIKSTSEISSSEISKDADNIGVGDFTNKNVFIYWEKTNIFNSDIIATYSLTNFSGHVEKQDIALTGFVYDPTTDTANTDATLFGANGNYTIKIYYTNKGKNGSYLTKSFTIDKQKISGLKALSYDTISKTVGSVPISTLENFNLITNQPFVWTWDEKESGAQITAKYYYSNISSVSTYNIEKIAQTQWVLANGEFGTLNEGQNYDPVNDLTNVSSSQVISTSKLALLLLQDQAGNTAVFITILDTIKPGIIQYTGGEQTISSHSLSETTEFFWGSHKALSINSSSDLMNNLSAISSTTSNYEKNAITYTVNPSIKKAIVDTFKSTSSQYYYILPIEKFSATLNESGGDVTKAHTVTLVPNYSSTTEEWSNTSLSVVVVINSQNKEYYSYLSLNGETPIDSNKIFNLFDEETDTNIFLEFTVNSLYDKIKNKANIESQEVSTDHSQGLRFSFATDNPDYQSYGHGPFSNTISYENELDHANRLRILNNYSTNRNIVTFSFLNEQTEPFIVKSITLYFYSLNYDSESENYPYSKTAEEIVLYSNSGQGSGTVSWQTVSYGGKNYLVSQAINTKNKLSQQGKYEIVREYECENITVEERNGDGRYCTYTLYVDRTGVITYLNGSYKTGESIALNFGEDTTKYTNTQKIFKSFTNQTKAQTEFSNQFFLPDKIQSNTSIPDSTVTRSNLLPASVSLNILDGIATKYDNIEKATRSSRLNVVIQYFPYLSYSGSGEVPIRDYLLFSSSATKNDDLNKVYTMSYLKESYKMLKTGFYRVIIFDTSNISKNLQSNDFSWDDLSIYDNTTLSFSGTLSPYAKSFSPNVASFTFEIKEYEPVVTPMARSTTGNTNLSKANIYIEDDETLHSLYYSGDDNLILTFTDTTDNLRAKIAYYDVMLSRSVYYVNSKGKLVTYEQTYPLSLNSVRTYDSSDPGSITIFSNTEIERINGTSTSTFTSMTLSTKDQDGGILYYREPIGNDRFAYYIILPNTPTTINGTKISQDQKFTFNFIYINSNYYEQAGNKESSYRGSVDVYVDHIAPFKNLVSLIEKDTFLNSAQKTELLQHLNDEDYTFFDNYAFAVGSEFLLTQKGDSESSSIFYYKYYSTFTPTTDKNAKYNLSTYTRCSYASSSSLENGYYDILEMDKAGNKTVYKVYVTNTGITMKATGSDVNNEELNFTFTAGYNVSGIPTYSIYNETLEENVLPTYIGKIENFYDETIADKVTLSNLSFKINEINLSDAWYNVKYRIFKESDKTDVNWTNISVSPQNNIDLNDIINELNEFIEENLSSKNDNYKIEIIINNRGGNDIHFFLNIPGNELTLSNLSPTTAANGRSFSIRLPADKFSTKYSNFSVKLNGTQEITQDMTGKTIQSINDDRFVNHVLTCQIISGTKYYFYFNDNFGKRYLFIYPSTSGLINSLTSEDGFELPEYNGIKYSTNSTKFMYTTGSTDRISISIIDMTTGESVLDETKPLVNLPYSAGASELEIPDVITAAEVYSTYFSQTKTGNVVTLTFHALTNIHYAYQIEFIDLDNNKTTKNFVIYSFAPSINLTDTSGINIWSSSTVEKVTSKNVVVKFNVNPAIFNGNFVPVVSYYSFSEEKEIFINTAIKVSNLTYYEAEIKNPGNYEIRIKIILKINNQTDFEIGIIKQATIAFTIKPATDEIYTVYFDHDSISEILTPHVNKRSYSLSSTETIMIDQYFFLSDSQNAFDENIRILPNEAQDLEISYLKTIGGNTRIYTIFGKVYKKYIAITQIKQKDGQITDQFTIILTTETGDVISIDEIIDTNTKVISPKGQENIYATINWNPKVKVDDSDDSFVDNFVYLEVYYNDIEEPIGVYRNGTLVLTESGNYKIKVLDVVGQTQRFKSKDSFKLTILNDIIYNLNGSTTIENATFNDSVTISIPNNDDIWAYYRWNKNGKITVYRNNVLYTGYKTLGEAYWRFDEAGFYKITLETKTATTGTADESSIQASITFTIIDKNESRKTYDFAKISGYYAETITQQMFNADLNELISTILSNYQEISEDPIYAQIILDSFEELSPGLMEEQSISSITQLAQYLQSIDVSTLLYYELDITEKVKEIEGTATLQSFSLSTENVGAGKYTITVRASGLKLNLDQSYSYTVWINDETPSIQCSRAFGTATTSGFTIYYNPSIIYEQVGNSYILISSPKGETKTVINAETAQTNKVITLSKQTETGTYFVQVYSNSGTLISSQRITINEPLNSATIILIIAIAVVVIGVVVTFIVLRTKMKVK